jgi:photosystem II stability/assembly factor-like uncharacterized protein
MVGRQRIRRQRQRALVAGVGICVIAGLSFVVVTHSSRTRVEAVTGVRPTASSPGKTLGLSLPLHATSISFISPVQGWAAGFAPVSPDPGGAVQTPSNIDVVHTSDGGQSWSGIVSVTTVPETAPQPVIDFEDTLHGWISGPGIFQTQDGGQTWNSANVAGLVVSLRPQGNMVWALQYPCGTTNCRPALLEARPGSTTWQPATPQPPGLGTGSAGLLRTRPSQAFVYQANAGNASSLDETTDGGATWRAVNNPCGTASNVLLSAADASNLSMLCVSEGGAGIAGKSFYASLDDGSSWTLQARAPTSDPAVGTITPGGYPAELVVTSARTGFIGLSRYGLIRSTDGGRTWNDAGAGDGPSGFVSDISFADAAHGWVIFCGGLERTADGGATWSTIGTAPGGPSC